MTTDGPIDEQATLITDTLATDLAYLLSTGGVDQYVALSNLLKYISDLTQLTTADVDRDVVPILEDPAGTKAVKIIEPLDLIKATMGMGQASEFQVREVLHEETLGASGRFDVSSIDQGYDDLHITAMLRGDVSATVDSGYMFFNNDTTQANYHRQYKLTQDGSTDNAESAAAYFFSFPAATAPSNSFVHCDITIPRYTSTSYLKVAFNNFVELTNTGFIIHGLYALVWEDGGATAINRITLQPDGYATDEFVANSYLRIVGVKTSA
jgi:hypothetical protein